MMADIDNGRNAVGQASYELGQSTGATISTFLNNTATAGSSATLIRIVGYNGQADDDDVEVDEAQGACTSTPHWNGTDLWLPSVDYGKRVGADYVPTMFKRAQVHGWTIDVLLDSSTSLPYTRAIRLHATISRASGQWFLSGEASARVLASGLLQMNEAFGACPGTTYYAAEKRIECSHADVDTDNDGICDALSEAWTLKAEEARLGCMHYYMPPTSCPTDAQPYDCTN
jgi:hypothetical protein